jgi:antitoxin (DNA-binding transcriptional repressor) of toxin-antitoxin stability system
MEMNMREVGAFEAKNTLSALLDLVEEGEDVLITRHGKPVAKLTRPGPGHDVARARAAAERIRELRKELKLGGLNIKELIEEGRM